MKCTNKIFTLILLLLSLALLTSCLKVSSDSEGQTTESKETEDKETGNPEVVYVSPEVKEAYNKALSAIVKLDNETASELENVYLAQSGYPLSLNKHIAEPGEYLGGDFCYGNFESCIVVFMPSELCVVSTKEIAGEVFSYRSSFALWGYYDGVFYRLDEAYEKGLITKEEVALAAERHRTIENYNRTRAHYEAAEFKLETPSEELQARFVNEYVAYMNYDPEDHRTVAIESWYGSFGDIHFLFVFDAHLAYTQAYWTDYIAGSSFEYCDGQSIMVWIDEQFLTMDQAYLQDLISVDMVKTIENIHNGREGSPIIIIDRLHL